MVTNHLDTDREVNMIRGSGDGLKLNIWVTSTCLIDAIREHYMKDTKKIDLVHSIN